MNEERERKTNYGGWLLALLLLVLGGGAALFWWLGVGAPGAERDRKLREARAALAEFAKTAEPWFYPPEEKIIGAKMPAVSPELARQIRLLQEAGDMDAAAELGALLVRFARVHEEACRTGGHHDRSNPVVGAFLAMTDAHVGSALLCYEFVRWIRRNREKLGVSPTLDEELKLYAEWEAKSRRQLGLPLLSPSPFR